MEPNNYANLEALANIIVNGVEILGIATGVGCLVLGWIPMACGAKGYTSKFYLACIANIVLGLGLPFVVNSFIGIGRSSNMQAFVLFALVLGAIFSLIVIAITFGLFFAPILIARNEKLEKTWMVALLNGLGIIFPPSWIAAIIVASLGATKKQMAPILQLIKEKHDDKIQ